MTTETHPIHPAALPAEGFLRVSVASLRLDLVAGFELYLPAKVGQPVLYRGANLAFTAEDAARLAEAKIDTILIRSVDAGAYQQYLEQNLGSILTDATLPMTQRSTMLYQCSQNLVKEILADPRSGEMMERTGDLVAHTVDFLFRESSSFEHLMQVTSYDYYTYTHSVNVFVFSTALAQRLGHSEEELHVFGQGALLHDVGKSRISPDIVNARGKLTQEQWGEMRMHTVYGDEILRAQGVTNEIILDVTRHHHEKLNGKGYPDGLKGDEISKWARMCTIADIFDALTTRRSYKEAMNSFPGLQFMREHMSDEIDPQFFRAFVGLMGRPG
jgi:putative nucleotidyltransferase with HDIG domain